MDTVQDRRRSVARRRVMHLAVALALCATALGCDRSPPRGPSGRPNPKQPPGDAAQSGATTANFATPQDVLRAAQAAAKDKDIARLLECHTAETLDGLTAYAIMAASMMRLVSQKLADRGDDRYLKSKERVDALLNKHGVDCSRISESDLQPGNPNLPLFRQLAAGVADRSRFLTEMLAELETAKGGASTGFQDELLGELVDLRIQGDVAQGAIVRSDNGTTTRKPVFFKKTKAGWRIHMPTE